jgi:hypothetical protein
MTEEASMEKFLNVALKKLLPVDANFIVIPHEGKQDLEKSIPKKLKAWRNNDEVRYQFFIIRDKDSGNCEEIKDNLELLCKNAGREDAVIIIAVHELEAWFIGDLKAVGKAYDIKNLSTKQNKKLYRNPDKIANASQTLTKICNDVTKVSRAARIAQEMDFDSNLSVSFNYFKKKIEEITIV